MAGLHSIPGLCGLERSGLRPGPPLFHSHSLCRGYKQHLSMHRYLLNGCLSSLNLLTPDWNAYCAFHTWMDNRHLKFKIFGTEHLNSTPKPPPRSLPCLSQWGFHPWGSGLELCCHLCLGSFSHTHLTSVSKSCHSVSRARPDSDQSSLPPQPPWSKPWGRDL